MSDLIRRTDTVKIKLAPDVLGRLSEQAQIYGMPPSTLCAFAVADWLHRQEANAKLTRMAVLDAARNSIPDADQMNEALAAALPAIVKALGQSNLLLEDQGC